MWKVLKSALDDQKGESLKALRVEEGKKLLELLGIYLMIEQRGTALPFKLAWVFKVREVSEGK